MANEVKLRRIRVMINGVERPILCNPEKDTLAVALRRMGLTGTKIGCGIGVCGACSVILNGEVVRACTKKMKNIAAFYEPSRWQAIAGNIDGIFDNANLRLNEVMDIFPSAP